jgi:hypothetical protein
MTHISPGALWTFGCGAESLNDVELEHVLTCLDCSRFLVEIEEALNEIAGEKGDQTIN